MESNPIYKISQIFTVYHDMTDLVSEEKIRNNTLIEGPVYHCTAQIWTKTNLLVGISKLDQKLLIFARFYMFPQILFII